ncbi:MAG TPA: hypothetical protein VFQ68_42100 [Streptosporangiaceae bacterium]|nr:hypothetical protein [Streptosporangiaceae bacterium]
MAGVTRRGVAASVAAACWLGLFAGIALIALDHRRGWIGVTVIFAALIAGIPVLAWLRRQQ